MQSTVNVYAPEMAMFCWYGPIVQTDLLFQTSTHEMANVSIWARKYRQTIHTFPSGLQAKAHHPNNYATELSKRTLSTGNGDQFANCE